MDETREKSGTSAAGVGDSTVISTKKRGAPILRYPQNRRAGLAKIEKMAEALEKKLIFLPKNDSL